MKSMAQHTSYSWTISTQYTQIIELCSLSVGSDNFIIGSLTLHGRDGSKHFNFILMFFWNYSLWYIRCWCSNIRDFRFLLLQVFLPITFSMEMPQMVVVAERKECVSMIIAVKWLVSWLRRMLQSYGESQKMDGQWVMLPWEASIVKTFISFFTKFIAVSPRSSIELEWLWKRKT